MGWGKKKGGMERVPDHFSRICGSRNVIDVGSWEKRGFAGSLGINYGFHSHNKVDVGEVGAKRSLQFDI